MQWLIVQESLCSAKEKHQPDSTVGRPSSFSGFLSRGRRKSVLPSRGSRGLQMGRPGRLACRALPKVLRVVLHSPFPDVGGRRCKLAVARGVRRPRCGSLGGEAPRDGRTHAAARTPPWSTLSHPLNVDHQSRGRKDACSTREIKIQGTSDFRGLSHLLLTGGMGMAESHSEGFVRRCHVGELSESGLAWSCLPEAKYHHLVGERESTMGGGAIQTAPGPCHGNEMPDSRVTL
ncbi:zinc finger protein 667 isoform X2 [Peromyscus maniculatus bairdii]|uniref:zinc finger protein 667 isoform X2 n=1 Tax=Peromyscus maniculatus bairdii TaxID=230844 RepID=UPI003FD0E86F